MARSALAMFSGVGAGGFRRHGLGTRHLRVLELRGGLDGVIRPAGGSDLAVVAVLPLALQNADALLRHDSERHHASFVRQGMPRVQRRSLAWGAGATPVVLAAGLGLSAHRP